VGPGGRLKIISIGSKHGRVVIPDPTADQFYLCFLMPVRLQASLRSNAFRFEPTVSGSEGTGENVFGKASPGLQDISFDDREEASIAIDAKAVAQLRAVANYIEERSVAARCKCRVMRWGEAGGTERVSIIAAR
jgi:hypothetical protein